jgi:uncharacterized protein YkwD
MLRVAVPVLLGLFLISCAAQQPMTAGYSKDAPAAPARVGVDRGAIASPQRTASLPDKAPGNSWAKAPKGALADRDYSGAKLDAERARQLINAYRKEKGLKPVELNSQLTLAAKDHARDLAKWDRISHYGSDGSNPWDRVKRAGYNPKVAAENVGTGQVSIEEVFKGWRESEGHNKNLLLPDATQMGVALVHDGKTEFKTFWTLVLGSPM